MSNNLHISMTEFRNQSRVIKEARSIIAADLYSFVYIAALHGEELAEDELVSDRITLKRFKLATKAFGKSLAPQLLKYIEFIGRIYLYYSKKKIGMINVHAVSLLPGGVLLARLLGAKLVYDTHELETETNGLGGLRKKIFVWIERRYINRVDYTIVVSESIADWYAKRYGILRPTVVLNVPKRMKVGKGNIFREKYAIDSRSLIFLYQGGFSEGRGIELMLSAFEKRSNKNAVLVCMGYGAMEQDIKKAESSCDIIYYHPSVEPDKVLLYTSSADVGLSLAENTCLSHYYCMPNKLFEYLMSGLPVIVSDMLEMRRFVEKYDVGVILEKEIPETLNALIDSFIEKDLTSMRLRARASAEDNSWEVQEKKMIALYQSK